MLCRACRIRLIILAGILSGREVALPIIDQFITIPRSTFAAVRGLLGNDGDMIDRLCSPSS
ncbi:hypothetical protein C9417_31750 [Rhizobium sp. SEMIA 4088]|nr:hypothetical protein C9417_31750 [Rhizobium sp. SEMIA 4088]